MIISVPLSVPVSKKKKFSLNINAYRNAHFQVLNTAKRNFEIIVFEQVSRLPKMENIELVYTIYFPDKRGRDVNNYCAVVDKFFADCLVKSGKIPDDNYKFLQKTTFIFGGTDKENPRCEIKVLDLSDINSK